MIPMDLTQYDFVFAVNSPHPLDNKQVIAFINGEYREVTILSVSGDREHNPDVLISEQLIIPEFLLEEITDSGERYIYSSYRGQLFDIEPAKPSNSELYGLIQRIENMLTSNSPEAAFSTAYRMMGDSEDLLRRCKALRDRI